MTDDRREFIVEAAWLHHEFGLTQDEIARRFGVSRSTVSRALAEAERLGIVQVVVTVPMRREARLGAALGDRLGVIATVGTRVGDESSSAAAARAAARLVERIAGAGRLTIGISWGRTLSLMARLVRSRPTAGVQVVDAVGHAGGERFVPAAHVSQSLATALGAAVVHVPAPAFVPDASTRAALLASPAVADALAIARRADLILVSVGVVGPDSLLVEEGLVEPLAVEAVVRAGAVGEILGRWYDEAGRDVPGPGPVAVGLSLDDLRAAKRVIAVAGGVAKATAVQAAVRGGIVDEIVVDDELAEALLAGLPATEAAGRVHRLAAEVARRCQGGQDPRVAQREEVRTKTRNSRGSP